MNWPKLKNIFIAFFFCINIVLLVIGYNSIQSSSNEKKMAEYAREILEQNGVKLLTDIPYKTAETGKPVTVEFTLDKKLISEIFMIEAQSSKNNFYNDGINGDNIKRSEANEADADAASNAAGSINGANGSNGYEDGDSEQDVKAGNGSERRLVFIGENSFEYFDFGNESENRIKRGKKNEIDFIFDLMKKIGITFIDYEAVANPLEEPGVISLTGVLKRGSSVSAAVRSYDDIVKARFDEQGILDYLFVHVTGISGYTDLEYALPVYKVLLSGYGDYTEIYDISTGFKRLNLPGTPEAIAVWCLMTDSGEIYYDAGTGIRIVTGSIG